LGIFLDNKPGSISEVMTQLDKLGIGVLALSVAEAGEFGLIRLVVDDPVGATRILEEANFNLAKSRRNTEVTVVLLKEKDKISTVTKFLGDNGVNIEYAYSSSSLLDGKLALVLRVNDTEKAEKTLKEHNITVLSLDDLRKRLSFHG